jgi:hypothetical protein
MMGKTSGDPVIELYQGGAYTRIGYSRAAPPPAQLKFD